MADLLSSATTGGFQTASEFAQSSPYGSSSSSGDSTNSLIEQFEMALLEKLIGSGSESGSGTSSGASASGGAEDSPLSGITGGPEISSSNPISIKEPTSDPTSTTGSSTSSGLDDSNVIKLLLEDLLRRLQGDSSGASSGGSTLGAATNDLGTSDAVSSPSTAGTSSPISAAATSAEEDPETTSSDDQNRDVSQLLTLLAELLEGDDDSGSGSTPSASTPSSGGSTPASTTGSALPTTAAVEKSATPTSSGTSTPSGSDTSTPSSTSTASTGTSTPATSTGDVVETGAGTGHDFNVTNNSDKKIYEQFSDTNGHSVTAEIDPGQTKTFEAGANTPGIRIQQANADGSLINAGHEALFEDAIQNGTHNFDISDVDVPNNPDVNMTASDGKGLTVGNGTQYGAYEAPDDDATHSRGSNPMVGAEDNTNTINISVS